MVFKNMGDSLEFLTVFKREVNIDFKTKTKREGPDGAEPSFGSTGRVDLSDAVLSFPAPV